MTCWRAYLRFEALLALLLPLCLSVASVARAQPVAHEAEAKKPMTAERLLKAFAGMPGLEARFVEEKHIAMLAMPLESQGTLYFARPGLLLRKVSAPRASRVLITPERLELSDADGKKSIELGARPDLRPFVESLVWILAGNDEALKRVYDIAFEAAGAGEPWQLTLSPRGAPLSQLITHIRIRGRGLRVEEIHVQESAGDRTVTRIVDADPARTYSAAERRQLFGTAGGS